MRAILYVVFVAIAVTALGFVGCSSSDNPIAPPPTGGGNSSVDVFLTDAPGDVSSLMVTLNEISFYNSAQSSGVALDPTGASLEIDLVAAAQSGGEFIRTFNVAQGDYECVSGFVEVTSFVVEDGAGQPQTCTSLAGGTDEVAFPPLCFSSGLLSVDEEGNVDILVDLPIINGECDPNTQEGTINFDFNSATASIR